MPLRPTCLLLSLAALPAFAQDAPTREHFARPGHEAAYHDWHYTPVVKVGQMVIVSGIPAAGPGTYEEKVRRMFVALGKDLAQAGATYADVVELTTFHTGPTDAAGFQDEFARFAPIHHEFFPSHYPAWSAVGTSALLSPGGGGTAGGGDDRFGSCAEGGYSEAGRAEAVSAQRRWRQATGSRALCSTRSIRGEQRSIRATISGRCSAPRWSSMLRQNSVTKTPCGSPGTRLMMYSRHPGVWQATVATSPSTSMNASRAPSCTLMKVARP